MQMFKKYRKQLRRKKAFTLLEMLIVLIVVALLMAIIIPNVAGQRDRINQQAAENIKEIIENQRNTYMMVENDNDVTLEELLNRGYITAKQEQEAEKFLIVSPSIGEQVEIKAEFKAKP